MGVEPFLRHTRFCKLATPETDCHLDHRAQRLAQVRRRFVLCVTPVQQSPVAKPAARHTVLRHQIRCLRGWFRPVLAARLRADHHPGKQAPIAFAIKGSQLFHEQWRDHVLDQMPHF
jgi:hypothetical protein